MSLVFINVAIELRETIKKQFSKARWVEIANQSDLNRIQSELTDGSPMIILFELTGNYKSLVKALRRKGQTSCCIALLHQASIPEIQHLVNNQLVDCLFRIPLEEPALLDTLAKRLKVEEDPAKLPGSTELAPRNDSIEESMVTSFYIYDLIYGDFDKANRIKSLGEKFGLTTFPNCAMTIIVDNFWEICRDLDNRSRYEIKMGYLSYLRDYIETASPESIACSLIGTDKLIILVNVSVDQGEDPSSTVLELARDLKKHINKKARNTVSIGIGNIYADSRLIWKSYEESFKALEYSFFLGSDKVIHYEETRNFTTFENGQEKLPNYKYNFFKHINNWSAVEIAAYYESTLAHLVSKSFSSETIKSIVIKYNFEILDFLEQMELADKELNAYVIKVSSRILRAATMEVIQEINQEYIRRIAEVIVKNRKSDDLATSIETAKAFIDKYYYRDLSLDLMAQVSNLSSAYFSRKFKERTGLNYSDYLERTRLEKAQELLLNSETSLNEIALKVGFNDYSYFSSRFKKKYGSGPSFYRRSKKEE